MQNGKTRTLLLPMTYDFHQLIKAINILMLQKKQGKVPKLHNANTPQHECTNNLISNYIPFIAEINAAVT
jgi:hypothetical protein